MKKQIAVILITLSLAAFSWAQGTNEYFDGKKSQEELEIMKGILNTTISLITQDNDQKGISIRRNPNIQAFYLAGQGAVFVIPISSSPSYNLELSRALDATRVSLNQLRDNLQFEILADGTMLTSAPPLPPAPPLPALPPAPRVEALEDGSLVAPAPPSPPALPESPIVDQEKLKAQIEKQRALMEEYREKVEEYREQAERQREEAEKMREEMREEAERQREEAEKQREEMREAQKALAEEYRVRAEKSREEEQKRREKLLQSLADIKVHLIEALANYGDSLTTVQPNEYINLILNTQNLGGERNRRFDTISAQKSWITDYKAGRLSLEGFKQKVRQYTQ